jgi:hypothetical protein
MKLTKYRFHLWTLVLAGLSLGIYTYLDRQPKKIISFEGVVLQETRDEVFYALGLPTTVMDRETATRFGRGRLVWESSPRDLEKLGKSIKDFPGWSYERQQTRLDIEFDGKGLVREIGCYHSLGSRQYLDAERCEVNGIALMDTEERIKEILGKPQSEYLEGPTKTLVYPNLNLKLSFTKKIVYNISVSEIKNSE